MATRITPLPTPVPQSSDPENFDVRADQFLTALPTFADEANAVAEDMDEAVDTAQAAASASLSNASFVGRWEDQTGSAAPPYSVFHGGLFWSLLEPIADVTSSEPDPYNLQWAVTGAPAWYNNFAVGDYLDTARSPGAGWLRRNGAAYPKSTYPELAPLMASIPASFAFTPVDLGITSDVAYVIEYEGKVVLWAETTNSIFVSEDAGETFDSVQVVTSARRFTNAAVFNGELLIGLDNGQYLRFDGLDGSPAVQSVTGFTTQTVFLAASPTAVVAVGQNPGTPASGQVVRRTTNLLTWTTPAVSGDLPFLDGGIDYVGGVFLTIDSRASQGTAMYSVDDGDNFARTNIPSSGAAANMANATEGLREVNGEYFGVGYWWQTSSVRLPAYFSYNEGFAEVTELFTDVPGPAAAGAVVTDFTYAEGVYLAFVSQFGVRCVGSWSVDREAWISFELSPGQIVRRSVVVGPWVIAVGPDGTVMRGRFIQSEAFRVPEDNPSTGWIKAVSDSPGTVGYDGVPEAPLSGGPYGRQAGAWVGMDGGGGEQVNADWNATEGPAEILNKPSIPSSPGGDFVGTNATQTLTNKTFGAGAKEASATAGTISITDASSPFQQITLTQNRTASINISVGVSRTVWINPGPYTITWPSGTVWLGGSAPSLPASKWSCITLTGMPGNTAGLAALVGSQP